MITEITKVKYTPLSQDLNAILGDGTNSKYSLGFSTKQDISNADWMNFLFGFSFVVIFILVFEKGIEVAIAFNSGVIAERNKGKETLRHILLGVVFLLGVWPLIYWLRPSMLSNRLTFTNTRTASVIPSTENNAPTPIVTAPVTAGEMTTQLGTDSVVRKKLNNAGIDTNHPGTDCSADIKKNWGRGQRPAPCTSLDGLPDDTVNMLIKLQSDCGGKSVCGIIITGGTEPGHASHGPRLPQVDLSCSVSGKNCSESNSKLNNFIKEKLNKNNVSAGKININGKSWSTCFNIYGPYSKSAFNGNFFFCDENIPGNPYHWHVFQS